MLNRWIILALLGVSLFSCNEEEKVKPEESAIKFFDALYNEKDLDKARQYASNNFKKKLAKYKNAKHASRQFFYLSFDKVKIEATLSNTTLRVDFNDNGDLTILFDGSFNGERIKEIRRIKMVQVGDIWLVDKLYKVD